jgi:site-specific recombinase XerD
LTATENDIIAHRKYLVETGYKPTTIALKLAVVRRLYEAIQWRGLRTDNPASGVKAPRDRTARDERVKYLPLEGLRQLLACAGRKITPPEEQRVSSDNPFGWLILTG